MKFHAFFLQVNGDVTDRQGSDSRKVPRNPVAQHLIEGWSGVLEDQFAGNPEKRGKFWYPTDESTQYRWRWDQFNPLSALCVVRVDGPPAFACLFLYGFEPLHDAAAVTALEQIMLAWLADTPVEPGFGLWQITERPAIIVIPFRTDVAARPKGRQQPAVLLGHRS
jgi:hypothetical protein